MSISSFIACGAALWLFSCGAALTAILWSRLSGRRRSWAALVFSCLALVSSYLGLSRYHFEASKTVNGHVQWSINSKWFFLAAFVLAVFSLALTLWNRWKMRMDVPPNA